VPENPQPSQDVSSGPPSAKPDKKSPWWFLNNELINVIQLCLITVFAAICIILGLLLQDSMQARNQMDRDIAAALNASIKAPSSPGGLPPAQQTTLNNYLTDASKPEAFQWWILFVGVVAAALFFVTKEHPSSTPLAVVIPLALAAVQNADHLSKYGGSGFWAIAVIIFVAVCVLMWGPSWLVAKDTGKGKDGEKTQLVSFPVMSFSVFVLGWTFVVVAHCSDCPTTKSPEVPCPNLTCTVPIPCCANVPPGREPSPSSTAIDKPVLLETRPYFASGKSDKYDFATKHHPPPGASKSLDDLLGKIKDGDLLLLLGSTDCKPFSRGNGTLAAEREKTLGDDIHRIRPALRIERVDIQQHDLCKDMDELRTVFPVLIPVNADGKK
jgi:hypothetical protein